TSEILATRRPRHDALRSECPGLPVAVPRIGSEDAALRRGSKRNLRYRAVFAFQSRTHVRRRAHRGTTARGNRIFEDALSATEALSAFSALSPLPAPRVHAACNQRRAAS